MAKLSTTNHHLKGSGALWTNSKKINLEMLGSAWFHRSSLTWQKPECLLPEESFPKAHRSLSKLVSRISKIRAGNPIVHTLRSAHACLCSLPAGKGIISVLYPPVSCQLHQSFFGNDVHLGRYPWCCEFPRYQSHGEELLPDICNMIMVTYYTDFKDLFGHLFKCKVSYRPVVNTNAPRK